MAQSEQDSVIPENPPVLSSGADPASPVDEHAEVDDLVSGRQLQDWSAEERLAAAVGGDPTNTEGDGDLDDAAAVAADAAEGEENASEAEAEDEEEGSPEVEGTSDEGADPDDGHEDQREAAVGDEP